jgi:hypothetical protein
MVKLALVVFAVVVLFLLALDIVIHTDQFRWLAGALCAYVAASLPIPDVAVPTRKQ